MVREELGPQSLQQIDASARDARRDEMVVSFIRSTACGLAQQMGCRHNVHRLQDSSFNGNDIADP